MLDYEKDYPRPWRVDEDNWVIDRDGRLLFTFPEEALLEFVVQAVNLHKSVKTNLVTFKPMLDV